MLMPETDKRLVLSREETGQAIIEWINKHHPKELMGYTLRYSSTHSSKGIAGLMKNSTVGK